MKNLKKLQKDFSQVSEFLTALGDDKRQAIIMALLADKACQGLQVTDLTDVTKLSRPAVSHHLKILKQAELIEVKTEGTKNFYFLSHDLGQINKLQKVLDEVVEIVHEENENDKKSIGSFN